MKRPSVFKSLLYTGLVIITLPIVIVLVVFTFSGNRNVQTPEVIVHTTISAPVIYTPIKPSVIIDTVKPVVKVKKKKIETVIDSVKIKEVKIDSLILNRDSV